MPLTPNLIVPIDFYLPNPEDVQQVSSISYEKALMEAQSREEKAFEDSFLKILNPHLLTKGQLGMHQPDYPASRAILSRLLSQGKLSATERPEMFVYHQKNSFGSFVGLICGVSIEAYQQNKVKKHELTQTPKENAICDFFEQVKVNGSQVLLTYPKNEKVNQVLNACQESKPLYDFHDTLGDWHQVWALSSEQQNSLQKLFDEIGCLYIADGHHRSAASDRYAQKNSQFTHFMGLLIAENDLKTFRYHRFVKTAALDFSFDFATFLKELEGDFELMGKGSEPEENLINIYWEDRYHHLRFRKPEILEQKYEQLEVSIINRFIFEKVLKIENVRSDDRILYIDGQEPLVDSIRNAKSSGAPLGFVCPKVGIQKVMEVADEGSTLPPKSTWILPKLRSGMIIHRFP